MSNKVEKIFEILKKEEPKKQQEILLECATKIGTPEWAEGIKDLIKRMNDLDKARK